MPIMSKFDKYFWIGKSLLVEDQMEILLSLVQNLGVFTWSLYEVPRVDSAFIMHNLNVNPLVPP